MATSSIFETVTFTDPKKAEAFIEAMDEAIRNPKPSTVDDLPVEFVHDPKEIEEFCTRLKKKYGKL